MEEMREVARAYYAKMSNDQQLLVLSFYKSLDTNGDGKVSPKEFSNFVKAKGNKRVPSNLFKLLDRSNDGSLDFDECVTFYYMFRVRKLAFCKGCGSFFWGVYFLCLDCYDDVHKETYNLCCSCFRNNKFKHGHSLFVDNYHLLTIKRKAFAKQGASSSQRFAKLVKIGKSRSLGASRPDATRTTTLQVMLEESDNEGGDKDLTHLSVLESKNAGALRFEPLQDEVVEVLDSDEMGKKPIKIGSKEVALRKESDDHFARPPVAKAKEDKTFIFENAKVEAAGSKVGNTKAAPVGGEDPTPVKGSKTPAGVTVEEVQTAGSTTAGARTASGDVAGDGDCGDTGFEKMANGTMVGASSNSEGSLVNPSAKVQAISAKTIVSIVGDPKSLATDNAFVPVVSDRLQEVVDKEEFTGSSLTAHPSQVRTSSRSFTPPDYEEVDDDLYSKVHAAPPQEIPELTEHTPLSIDQQARHPLSLPSVSRGVVTQPATSRNEVHDDFAPITQSTPLKQAFQTLNGEVGNFLEEPFLNQDGSRGSFRQRDLGALLSFHFQSEIQDEEDQGEDTVDDMPRSNVIAGVYIGVEHYPILKEIERRYPNVYSNLLPKTTWLAHGILTSFATFITEVQYTRVDELDASKIKTFLVALKDFEQTGLDVSWIRPRFEEAQSIYNLKMFARDLELSKAVIIKLKRELAELEADVIRRESELANAKRAAPTSLVDGDLVLKGIF